MKKALLLMILLSLPGISFAKGSPENIKPHGAQALAV